MCRGTIYFPLHGHVSNVVRFVSLDLHEKEYCKNVHFLGILPRIPDKDFQRILNVTTEDYKK